MPFVSLPSCFDSYTDDWKPGRRPTLTEQFSNLGNFLRGMRVRMRFGELSRAPVRLLRLHMIGEVVKCDWLARPPDPWAASLPPGVRARHASLQALRDAIDVRALLFDALAGVETADFRVYRETATHAREMIITGCTQRNDNISRGVHSLVMRAKILGFRFQIEDDILRGMVRENSDLP